MPGRTLTPQHVPSDVTDEQKYWYFGRQQRWFLVVRFVTFLSLVASLSRFCFSNPHLSALMFVVLMLVTVSVISLYTSTRPRALSRDSHDERVRRWTGFEAPTVDVLLPSAGERLDVLANTYRHVARMKYPGQVRVYVLDDAGLEDVSDLAAHFGFSYLSRPDRGWLKKAGNLAFGYRNTGGDIIAVFDADFAPRLDYLLELVPYLDDPAVGIIQSPQFFDTRGSTPWLQRAAGAAQELFYRWVQPSRDALGAPICVGTCALYRRAALERAGGFAQIAHSEDVHTGVAVMAAGYDVRYVPVILAKGLCPEGIHPFLNQQYRWCAGALSLMINSDFHAMSLSWRQRLCFWSGFGYYISTAITAFTALIPPIYLLWLEPHAIHDRNYLLLVPVVLAYPLIVFLHRGRWSFAVLRIQLAYSFAHAVAVWDTWRGHTAEWVATGATRRTNLSSRVSWIMCCWLVGVQVLLWAGIIHDLSARILPLSNMYPLILFASFAFYLQVPLVVLTLRRPVAATMQPGRVAA